MLSRALYASLPFQCIFLAGFVLALQSSPLTITTALLLLLAGGQIRASSPMRHVHRMMPTIMISAA